MAKKVVVKHYGTHTCPIEKRGRTDKEFVANTFKDNPKITRKTFIRQQVQKELESGTFESAKNLAKTFTDTKFIENIKQKSKMDRRPDGHSFNAIRVLKEKYENQDKFLIFDYSSGDERSSLFVMKSSKLKVKLMKDLNRDGSHPLFRETEFLDVLHSRCKGWKTYTLSFCSKTLRQMIKLATLETDKENGDNCELFFTLINQMIKCFDYEENSSDKYDDTSTLFFNPYHLKDDEHGAIRLAFCPYLVKIS